MNRHERRANRALQSFWESDKILLLDDTAHRAGSYNRNEIADGCYSVIDRRHGLKLVIQFVNGEVLTKEVRR